MLGRRGHLLSLVKDASCPPPAPARSTCPFKYDTGSEYLANPGEYVLDREGQRHSLCHDGREQAMNYYLAEPPNGDVAQPPVILEPPEHPLYGSAAAEYGPHLQLNKWYNCRWQVNPKTSERRRAQ